MRKAGMLLPVASLPGKYGIGSFSKEAYKLSPNLRKILNNISLIDSMMLVLIQCLSLLSKI